MDLLLMYIACAVTVMVVMLVLADYVWEQLLHKVHQCWKSNTSPASPALITSPVSPTQITESASPQQTVDQKDDEEGWMMPSPGGNHQRIMRVKKRNTPTLVG